MKNNDQTKKFDNESDLIAYMEDSHYKNVRVIKDMQDSEFEAFADEHQ